MLSYLTAFFINMILRMMYCYMVAFVIYELTLKLNEMHKFQLPVIVVE